LAGAPRTASPARTRSAALGTGDVAPMSSTRAIVIGSGFGGLAVANRLQASGIQTTILEKREKIGGRAYQFEEAGYRFDMGPSLITAPDILESVFQSGGRSMRDYLEL